jgi:hypothetical protein
MDLNRLTQKSQSRFARTKSSASRGRNRVRRRPYVRRSAGTLRRAPDDLGGHRRRPTVIAERGFDPIYGARPLRRFISREVETRIGRALPARDVQPGAVIRSVSKPTASRLTTASRA